jgi:hypothetical protein
LRSARAPRLLLELSVVLPDELPMLELLPEVEGEALVSLLDVEPEDEPEAPMPDELVLGVVLDEEELAPGVVLGVVLEDDELLLGVLEPEAPIEPLEELLGVLLEDDDGVLDEDEDEGVVDDEPAPMLVEPALSPPAFGAVELVLASLPVPLLEVPTPEAEEPEEPELDWAAA